MVVYVQMELGNIMLQNFIDNFLFVYDIVLYVVNERVYKCNLLKLKDKGVGCI